MPFADRFAHIHPIHVTIHRLSKTVQTFRFPGNYMNHNNTHIFNSIEYLVFPYQDRVPLQDDKCELVSYIAPAFSLWSKSLLQEST